MNELLVSKYLGKYKLTVGTKRTVQIQNKNQKRTPQASCKIQFEICNLLLGQRRFTIHMFKCHLYQTESDL